MSTSPGGERQLARRGTGRSHFGSSGGALPRLLVLLGLVGGAVLPAACVTSGEGDKMKTELGDLRARLDDIDKRDAEYKEQVARLRKVLDQATALLTRNSADVGAKAAKAETDIAALQGRIEELTHAQDQRDRQNTDDRTQLNNRLAALEQTQTKIVDKVAPSLPDDKDQLWQQASSRLSGGQRDEGRRFYRVFIQRFPQDPRASQAYLAIGNSFVAESKYPNAAAEFQKILDVYPRSPEVPEAMWQLSSAFVQLKFCTDARALLSDLVKRYPRSPRAAEAKSQIKQLGKMPKSSCTS
ncbi:MAG TPA: tetratricopeptide repeat protein [Polyangia bacterium]|nr:tetratricopeptide repeat protein [Polyangia bacterium]